MDRSSSADHACMAALSVRSGKVAASKSACRLRGLPVVVFRRFLVVEGVAVDFFLAAEADMLTAGRGIEECWDESVVAELSLQVQGPTSCRQDAGLCRLQFYECGVEGLQLRSGNLPRVRLAQLAA